MNNVQLIIPMTGTGDRFIAAGFSRPKPLIEIDGKPMIQHVLGLFPGITDVLFICNEDHLQNTDMRQVLEEICPTGKIISIESHKKGPVYAVSQVYEYIDNNKEVIVSYCDYGTKWNFDKFLEDIRFGNFDGGLACYKGFHPHMLGSDNYAFCREANNVLLEIKEKEPFTNDRMSEFASNGTYYFKNGNILKKYFSKLINLKININGEYYVSLVYNLMIQDGLRSKIYEIEKMLQWGTPYDLAIYQSWSDLFTKLKNPPIIAPRQDFTLVLPMAGKGERFCKEGYTVPKPFIPVDNVPMVIRAINCLPLHKNAVFICLQEHKKEIEREQESTVLPYYVARVHYIDSVTEGQACTCEIGIRKDGINENTSILISACDNGALYNQQKFIDLINDEQNDIIVWSFRGNQTSKLNPNMYSWLEIDENDFVKNVSCKKFPGGDPLKTHAIIGTMYFRKSKYFLDGLNANRQLDRRVNGEFYVDDVLNQNIAAGLKVKVFEVDHYVCWGTPNDLKTYNYWKEYFESI